MIDEVDRLERLLWVEQTGILSGTTTGIDLATTTESAGRAVSDTLDFIPAADHPTMPLVAFLVLLGAGWWRYAEGNGYIVQRLAASKDEIHAQGASLWFAIAHNALRPWPWIVVGLAALIVYPRLAGVAAGVVAIGIALAMFAALVVPTATAVADSGDSPFLGYIWEDADPGTIYTPKLYSGSMYWVAQEITGAAEYWNDGYTGAGVDVAIVDTGVVPVDGLTWPGKVINGPDLSFESQSDDFRYLDTYGHGTHLAGIIAGRDDAAAFRVLGDGTQDALADALQPGKFAGGEEIGGRAIERLAAARRRRTRSRWS